jgi:glycosyltransferase involved in cell wall biosynthesis
MDRPDILIIGPIRGSKGGINQYAFNQQENMMDKYDVRLYSSGAYGESDSFSNLLTTIHSIFQILGIVLEDEPNIVHIHSAHGISFYRNSLFIFVISLIWDSSIILHIHGSRFDEFINNPSTIKRWYLTKSFNRTSTVIVLSEYWKKILEQERPSLDIRIVANSINISRYTCDEKPKDIRIAYISELSSRKGIKLFCDVVKDIDSYQIDIAGKGEYSDYVASIASENDNINYHGFVSEDKKIELLCSSSIFVLPSQAEGMPIVILEAMATSNAIISTSVGSIPELISEENGILIEPKNRSQLEIALSRLLAEQSKLNDMGETNRRLVSEEHDWESAINKLSSIYFD